VSNVERIFVWVLLIVVIGVGSCIAMQFREENRELRSALYRAHENQGRLNENFRQFTSATELQLSRLGEEIQNINSRIGSFRALKDSESGAIVWE
jgi:hypothetical protein